MRDRIPKSFYGLAGERTAALVGDGYRDHDRYTPAMVFEKLIDREERRFHVQVSKTVSREAVHPPSLSRGLFVVSVTRSSYVTARKAGS